jgi:uncharacterized protein YbaP (TraB family)
MRRFLFTKRLMAVIAAALLAAMPASAQTRIANIAAHPALWSVRTSGATVYLFGSLHLLPANLVWHTLQIDAALAASGIFVFEAPLDESGTSAVAEFVRKNGALPPGKTLPSLLDAKSLADYRAALATAGIAPDALDRERPWLAAIAIDVAYLQRLHYLVADGVDRQIYALARARKCEIRSLETVDQQMALFMPKDEKLERAEFDSDLREFRDQQNTIGAMVDAWSAGDVKRVGNLVARDLDPAARKLLIDDRNTAWVTTLETMLAAHGTYFVTVGTGHLAGPNGVPALLRARGSHVDGP